MERQQLHSENLHRRGGELLASSKFATRFSLSFKAQYNQRVASDPNFFAKSITEIVLAAATQFTAEISRRGTDRMLIESDFVIAGILTAIAGKYYSMWKVAPTSLVSSSGSREEGTEPDKLNGQQQNTTPRQLFWKNLVPTNAFQPTLLDGFTKPTLVQRLAAFVAPMPSLFQAGFISSAIGYGLTGILITIRTLMVPSFVAATVNVNIVHACLYTGAFLAIISNIRYQILQGIIEPRIIDTIFGERLPWLRAGVVFSVRLLNRLLGSTLAIIGMKLLKLQRLKQ